MRAVEPTEGKLCTRLGAILVSAYLRLPGRVPEPGYEEELADVAARAAMADTEVLVAFDEGTALGCVTYLAGTASPISNYDDPDAAGFRMLGVDPTAQGRGVGAALVSACLERATSTGRGSVVLHTTRWMHTAHRMYERFGFIRDETLDWSPVAEVPLLGYRLVISR